MSIPEIINLVNGLRKCKSEVTMGFICDKIIKALSKDTEILGDVIITGAVTTTHKLGDVLKISGKNLITKAKE